MFLGMFGRFFCQVEGRLWLGFFVGSSGGGVRFICLEMLSGCSFSQLFVLCTPVLEPDLHCTGEHIELGRESLAD